MKNMFSKTWYLRPFNNKIILNLDEKNEKVIMPCYCVGSLANVHLSCLEDWLTISKIHHCEICKFKFNTVNRTISIFEVK